MEKDRGETAVAQIPQLPGQIAPIEWLKPLPAIGGYTSLDLATDRGRALFVKSQQGDPENLDKFINQSITVCDIVMHPAKRENAETGEVEFWTRCVLVGPAGEIISCGSMGIMKSLMLAVVLNGPPPWKAGIKGILRQKPISDSKRWYQIEWELPTWEATPTPTPASGNHDAKKKSPAKP